MSSRRRIDRVLLHAPNAAIRQTQVILRYCASGYVAGVHWNDRECRAWTPSDVLEACDVTRQACEPGGDPEAVLSGLTALAEMLQVDLPGSFGLDLLVEELVLLPRDLLETAFRGVARRYSYRRFPTLAEIRSEVVDQMSERLALDRAVRALAREYEQRTGSRIAALSNSAVDQSRGGGLRMIATCLSVPRVPGQAG